MKTFLFLPAILVVVICSCNSNIKPKPNRLSFGIYETVKITEMPNAILDTLRNRHIVIEKDQQQSTIGYIPKADSMVFQPVLSKENVKLVKTIYTVDNEQKNYGIVALKSNPGIDNSDIKKTKSNGNKVEIYFNSKGANKWAELTRKNIGNSLAFIIDNQIYSMPLVNGEIKNGMALINGLENVAIAKSIAESLNP